MPDNGLMLVVSQSGETADTLASLRYAKAHGQKIIGVVNVPTSTIARESDVAAPTLAGPEIGVASTKAFTCQLTVLAALAIALGRARGVLGADEEKRLVNELMVVPGLLAEAMKLEPKIEAPVAPARQDHRRALSRARHVLSAGAGRRAEAEGNLLHSRRGLCGGRVEARADRADRRAIAGDRDRADRSGAGKDRLEPSGSVRARRKDHSGRRRPRASSEAAVDARRRNP